MAVNVVVGLQRGDEGKGRFVDMLAAEHDIVARFNGGDNAGHTVVLPDGRELALHLIPCGIAHPHVLNIIGNGTLINPVSLAAEIDYLEAKGLPVSRDNLRLSSAASMILPHHIVEDELREATGLRQGTTKSGIAQVSSDKALRSGIRVEIIKNDAKRLRTLVIEGLTALAPAREALGLESLDIETIASAYVAAAARLKPFVTDTVFLLNSMLRAEKPPRVLAEGAQAFLLDVDHGMHPFTTSTSTTSGGATTGLGVAPQLIAKVIGVAKAIQSHVGDGPFVTEIHDLAVLDRLHGDMTTIDAETGTTTGRIRRLGYLDLPQIRRSMWVNGVSEIALTKLDWLSRLGPTIRVCVGYRRKGKLLEVAPDASYKLDQCEPVYEVLPGWTEDISGVGYFAQLPTAAQDYVRFLEKQLGARISMLGVGPSRDAVIVRV